MTTNQNNPFPGLRSFDINESHLFFGREEHVTDLLNKLNANHFVAVVGTSGTGKSSLIKAGVLPALKKGEGAEQGRSWVVASMKPSGTPLQNLARSLVDLDFVDKSGDPNGEAAYSDILNKIQQNSLGLVQAMRSHLKPDQQLLILVDQFEEIFRFSNQDNASVKQDADNFVNLLVDTIRQRDIPIYVVLTLRSDFLGDCVKFDGLPEAINDGHYLVPRMNKDQNRRVITGPVEYAEGKISPRLVQHVISHLSNDMDQLPVLQHALMRTWDSWIESAETGEPMDMKHYERIGGMENALSDHADEAYMEVPEQRRELLAHVFRSMTLMKGDSRGVRRPTSVSSLMKICEVSKNDIIEVLAPFRKKGRSFILPDGDTKITEDTIIDISHESLMRGWNRLHEWVEAETESASIYERLCTAAILQKSGKAGLWRDPELQLAIDWKNRNKPNESWSKQYNNDFELGISFLEESRKQRDREILASRKRRNLVRSAVIIFMVVVSALTAWALFQTQTAKENTKIAELQTEEALNQKKLAEAAKEMALDASKRAVDAASFAQLQSNIAAEQKTIAEEQKSIAEQETERALQQQKLAVKSSEIADIRRKEALAQKQKADSAEAETKRLRMISVSQNVAFKSMQLKSDPELAALLAYRACILARENKANMHDQQLYAALFEAVDKYVSGYSAIGGTENSEIKALQYSGDGISIIKRNGEVKKYRSNGFASAGKSNLSNTGAGINTAYLNSAAEYALVGSDAYTGWVYNLSNTGKSPVVLKAHKGLIRAAAFTKGNETIATGGRDSLVVLWKGGSMVSSKLFSSRIKALSFIGSSGELLVGCEDGNVFIYNTSSGDKRIVTSNPGSRVEVISVDESSSKAIIGFSSGTVKVISKAGSVLHSFSEKGIASFVDINSSRDLLVVGTSAKLIRIYKLSDSTVKPLEIKNINSPINSMSLGSDGFVYVGCADNSVRRYPVKVDYFESLLKNNLKRELTTEEWNSYLGTDVPK